MAASGYTPILIYGSGTSGNTPSAGNMTTGASGVELALNYADGKLFYKDGSGTIKVLAGTGGTGVVAGSNTQLQFNNSGVFGASSGLTWDGTSLTASNYVSAGNITINTNKFTVAGATGNTLIAGTATVGTLTNTRLVFAGAAGVLSDSASLTWSGTVLGTTGFTASSDSTFTSTGALTISKGTTAQRPTASSGMLRFNTTTSEFEGYNGTTWASVGGAAIVNDTTTATALYPLFASSTSGTATTLYTGNAKLLYTPSNGELQAGEMYANNGVLTHANQVTADYVVPTGANVITVGPWTVASGASFTLPSGSRQVLL